MTVRSTTTTKKKTSSIFGLYYNSTSTIQSKARQMEDYEDTTDVSSTCSTYFSESTGSLSNCLSEESFSDNYSLENWNTEITLDEKRNDVSVLSSKILEETEVERMMVNTSSCAISSTSDKHHDVQYFEEFTYDEEFVVPLNDTIKTIDESGCTGGRRPLQKVYANDKKKLEVLLDHHGDLEGDDGDDSYTSDDEEEEEECFIF